MKIPAGCGKPWSVTWEWKQKRRDGSVYYAAFPVKLPQRRSVRYVPDGGPLHSVDCQYADENKPII